MFQKQCKVCFDSGKSKDVYTSHSVKKCPTLAACQCRKCFQYGHTIKYCQVSLKPPTPTNPVPLLPVLAIWLYV